MWNKIYLKYKYRIFPRVKHLRGMTRFLGYLERKALSQLESIDEEKEESIFKEDWDNLIIADACRKDVLEEVLGREIESRYTLGSRSPEYIKRTFSTGDFSDIVYITANPFFNPPKFKELTGRNIENVFYEVFHTYKTDWDEEKGTVMPEKVIRDAKTAENLFPDKKKIIHFMQPHYPFIDYDIGKEQPGFNPDHKDYEDGGFESKAWGLGEKGELDTALLWSAYKSNTEKVVYKINDSLLPILSGKTVLTADHGNLMGEKGLYGHPPNNSAKPLREVPFVKIQ